MRLRRRRAELLVWYPPHGLGCWAAAAVSSRLRQDSTAMQFRVRCSPRIRSFQLLMRLAFNMHTRSWPGSHPAATSVEIRTSLADSMLKDRNVKFWLFFQFFFAGNIQKVKIIPGMECLNSLSRSGCLNTAGEQLLCFSAVVLKWTWGQRVWSSFHKRFS